MKDPEGLFEGDAKKSHFAIKVSTVRELPTSRVLTAYIKEAVKLKDWGVNVHNVFLSDVSNAFVVRHLGSYEGGSSPQFFPISPEDLAEGR